MGVAVVDPSAKAGPAGRIVNKAAAITARDFLRQQNIIPPWDCKLKAKQNMPEAENADDDQQVLLEQKFVKSFRKKWAGTRVWRDALEKINARRKLAADRRHARGSPHQ
jgi:hypothetical protein